jgi:hypothetical protein
MGSLSAAALLRVPVRLHGIQLGRPTDLLVDVESWQVLGFVVHCGDEGVRFLPWAASQPLEAEIAVGSALLLLEDVAFYAKRSVSLRSLIGGELPVGGVLRDVLIGGGGAVTELEIERDGARRRMPCRHESCANQRDSGVTEATLAASMEAGVRSRAHAVLRTRRHWVQLGKFCAVGAVGYVVNLVVYATLLHAGFHYLLAATCSFLVAVSSNYLLNRLWTFRDRRGGVAIQECGFSSSRSARSGRTCSFSTSSSRSALESSSARRLRSCS